MTAKGTTEVVRQLKRLGYELTPAYVNYLMREGILPQPPKGPGGVLCWGQADIDRLRSILRRRGRGPVQQPLRQGV